MASPRELLKRKKAVTNTRKITRTMELVASSKLAKAQAAASASRPYAEALADMVQQLASASKDTSNDLQLSHPLMEHREPKRAVLIVCTSDRGLCGAFNGNLVRVATKRRDDLLAQGTEVEVIVVGKKAASVLRFLRVPVAARHDKVIGEPRYEQAMSIAEPLIERFMAGEVDLVEVVYSRFISQVKQANDVLHLLPAGAHLADDIEDSINEHDGDEGYAAANEPWLYHPDAQRLLEEIIPQTVRIGLFSAFIQTSAGEHAARRLAMKNATDNANDLIKTIGRQYNRARQTKITQEIAEITGAVEAMG